MLLILKDLKSCLSFSEHFHNTPPTPLFRGESTSFPSIKRGRGVSPLLRGDQGVCVNIKFKMTTIGTEFAMNDKTSFKGVKP